MDEAMEVLFNIEKSRRKELSDTQPKKPDEDIETSGKMKLGHNWKPEPETEIQVSLHEINENDDQGLLFQTPLKEEFQGFQNPAPKNYKPNLTDSQTKPGVSVNYLEITPQPCNFISEYPRCQQVVAEQETLKTSTETLYAESESEYVIGIVATEDSPPEKSMKAEAKVYAFSIQVCRIQS